MPHFFCCVPGCNAATLKTNLQKYPWMDGITFHAFPTVKNPTLRKKWLDAVRRDFRWRPNKYTRVCSLHFEGSSKQVPTLFPYNNWGDREAVLLRPTKTAELARCPLPDLSDRECGPFIADVVTQESYPYICGEVVLETTKCMEKASRTVFEATPLPFSDHAYTRMTGGDIQMMDVSCQTDLTAADIEGMKCQQRQNKELSEKLENRSSLLRELVMDKVTESDTSVRAYTGFPKKKYLNGVFNILDESESKLNYWKGGKIHKQQSYQIRHDQNKSGPRRKLSRYEEFILTWMRVRLGLTTLVLGHLFGISQSRVSQIFITWTTFMYFTLGKLLKWPSREQVQKHMPPSFRKKYPKTRAIIDCTEFFFQKPRSPHAQSATYSSYKSRNTAKLLVSITPAGSFNFISELYGGNTSDRYITEHSGFLEKLEYGDDVMADRGFKIRDLVTLKHATLNIPPFTRKCPWGKGKYLTLNEIAKTRSIAKVRIHVERAIQRMKLFRLINQIIPWSLKPMMNQIVTIVAVVCNMYPKLVRQ